MKGILQIEDEKIVAWATFEIPKEDYLSKPMEYLMKVYLRPALHHAMQQLETKWFENRDK